MYINKLIKKQVMLILATVVLVGTLAVTTSFAVFEETKSNATDQKMTIGNLDVTYTGGSAISITDINPMTDSTALSKTNNIYTFTIKNTGTVPYNFKVKVINNPSYTSNLLPHQYIRYSLNNGTASTLGSGQGDYELTSGVIEAGATNTYNLRLWVADASTYNLPNSVLGQEIHLKISVEGKAGTGWGPKLKDVILVNNEVKDPLTIPGQEISAYTKDDITKTTTYNVSSTYQSYYFTYGTGFEANGSNFNLTGAAVTSDTYANSYSSLVGKYFVSSSPSDNSSSTAGTLKTTTNLSSVYYVVSATASSYTYKTITSNKNVTEALLASTEDDYGTSYYFRGNVKNNYLEFANKCWRIVRIAGDGTVKLALHNDNVRGLTNPCSSANNSASAAFASKSETSGHTSEFNSSRGDNAYVGFMYGQAGASDYASTHANTNKSTILTNLEMWYNTNNLTSRESKIADTVWCNDKSTVTDTIYNPRNYGNVTGLGYGTNVTYYGATKRLVDAYGNAGGTGPSLKCNGKLSEITTKVGLLTADELAYAGYAAGLYSYGNYLQENATWDWWWSLSPYVFNDGLASIWCVFGGYGSFTSCSAEAIEWFRPSISLVSSATISGGTGTSEDPYVVE